MENMIDITGTDLVKLAQEAYALSRPQGMGMLHYRDGGLSAEEAQALLDRVNHKRVPLGMDYVHGRAVKLTVFKEDGKLWIGSRWYDHNATQLRELLKRIGKEDKSAEVND